jgi:RNA polymerase sigma-70 factor, ECF subfamily
MRLARRGAGCIFARPDKMQPPGGILCQIPATVPDERAMTPIRPDARDEDVADVERVMAGDLDAFGGIVRRWQGRLVSLAWRFCRDRTMAEDMAQEAFVRAFRALRAFRGESAFSTWLTAIAMNTYRTSLRDRPPVAVAMERVPAAGGNDPLAVLEQERRAEAARQLVMTLPRKYRETIVLFYFEEMNLVETARILGVPEGTVKARLHRGRELLKRRGAARLFPNVQADGR